MFKAVNKGDKKRKATASLPRASSVETIAESLPENLEQFKPLFERCEVARKTFVGTMCADSVIVKYSTQYDDAYITIGITSDSLMDMIGKDMVTLLCETGFDNLGFKFPKYIPGDKDMDVACVDDDMLRINCKVARACVPKDMIPGSECVRHVVIIPGAYKPFDGFPHFGINFRVVFISD